VPILPVHLRYLHCGQQLAPPGTTVEQRDGEVKVHKHVHGEVGDDGHPGDGRRFAQLIPKEGQV
jgi:hypothetical protein